MRSTRSQTRKQTRSSSGIEGAGKTGTLQSKTTSTSETRSRRRERIRIPVTSASRVGTSRSNSADSSSEPEDGRDEASSLKREKKLIWRLTKELFPLSNIILKPFRKTHSIAIVIICLTLLMIYPVSDWLRENLKNSISSLVFPPPHITGKKILIQAPRHRWIDRLEEVKNLTLQLNSLSQAHKGREIHLYVVGGPGSGKSELVRQVGLYLHEIGKSNFRPLDVLTFETETVDALMHSFVEVIILLSRSNAKADSISQIRDELNLQRDLFQHEGDVLTAEKKVKILFAKLKELLEQRNSRPVLIFDNVRDLNVLYKYLKLEPGKEDPMGLTVLATIQKRVSLYRTSAFTAVVDIYDGMSQEEAIGLLNVITGLNEDSESANELADILGNQPLALAAAAIYIESVREGPPKKGYYSYTDYVSEFKRDMELLGLEEQVEWDESVSSNYVDAMHLTVLKAANRTAQVDPVLRDIAFVVGFADSTRLSLSFVQDYLKSNSHYDYLNAQVRNTLRNCVLFKITGDEGGEQLTSHQVTREAFRKICKVSRFSVGCHKEIFCAITYEANSENKSNEYGRNLLRDTLTRIVVAFQKQMYSVSSFGINSQNVSKVVLFSTNSSFGFQFLDVLTSLCIHTTREKLEVEEVINIGFSKSLLRFFSQGYGYWPSLIKPMVNEYKLRNLLELTSSKTEGTRYDLQTLLLIICVHNGAAMKKNILINSLNKTSNLIVKITQANVDDTRKDELLPVYLNILGVMYRGLGYPYNSRALHQLALEAYNNNKGKNNMELKLRLEKATTLHKLGIINRYLGDLTRAKECHRNSLHLLEGIYGPRHPSVASSLLNLAVVYSRQGAQIAEALQLYNRSLTIMAHAYGPRHPHVGRVFNTIGTVYYKVGEFRTAIKNSEHGLEILEEFHGTYHPHVAEALNFLGFMYRDQGNLIKSREVLEKSLHIKKRVFDPDHFILGEALNDLGVVYTRLGQAQKAKMTLKMALEIFKRTWGPRHSAVATATNSLGAAYLAIGDPRAAETLHKEALNIFIEIDGRNSHSVAETRILLGKTYQAMGELKTAEAMYQQAYDCFKKLYGAQHWRVSGALNNLNVVRALRDGSCTIKVDSVRVVASTLTTMVALYNK